MFVPIFTNNIRSTVIIIVIVTIMKIITFCVEKNNADYFNHFVEALPNKSFGGGSHVQHTTSITDELTPPPVDAVTLICFMSTARQLERCSPGYGLKWGNSVVSTIVYRSYVRTGTISRTGLCNTNHSSRDT